MASNSARAQWAARIAKGTVGKGSPLQQPVPVRKVAFQGIVMGIDPSLRGTGLAVLEIDSRGSGRLLHSETVRPARLAGLPECLGCIAAAVCRVADAYSPVSVAIEETIYVQNLRTAQKLGAARGAAIGQVAIRGLPVFEYAPLRIKQAVIGYGRASKEQVSRQIQALLHLPVALPFDEADAAATALCHAWTTGR